jgi:polyphosphate kinase 2 (PPK2 family)
MLAKTETNFAPWTVIESHDKRFATVKVFKTVIDRLEAKIEAATRTAQTVEPPMLSPQEVSVASEFESEAQAKLQGAEIFDQLGSSVLDRIDLSVELSQEAYKTKLEACQQRIFELEHDVYVKRIPVVIVYQGWDAAGKGGNIRRLTQSMDPRGYEVIPIAAPNDVEKSHHYCGVSGRNSRKPDILPSLIAVGTVVSLMSGLKDFAANKSGNAPIEKLMKWRNISPVLERC